MASQLSDTKVSDTKPPVVLGSSSDLGLPFAPSHLAPVVQVPRPASGARRPSGLLQSTLPIDGRVATAVDSDSNAERTTSTGAVAVLGQVVVEQASGAQEPVALEMPVEAKPKTASFDDHESEVPESEPILLLRATDLLGGGKAPYGAPYGMSEPIIVEAQPPAPVIIVSEVPSEPKALVMPSGFEPAIPRRRQTDTIASRAISLQADLERNEPSSRVLHWTFTGLLAAVTVALFVDQILTAP